MTVSLRYAARSDVGMVRASNQDSAYAGPDLLILAGRPSVGKTALATNMAFNVARAYQWEPTPEGRKTVNGGVVAFYSLEMSAEQLAMRILADASGVSSDKLRKGEIDKEIYVVRRLQAELRRVTEERDILKKAAAYFAKQSG